MILNAIFTFIIVFAFSIAILIGGSYIIVDKIIPIFKRNDEKNPKAVQKKNKYRKGKYLKVINSRKSSKIGELIDVEFKNSQINLGFNVTLREISNLEIDDKIFKGRLSYIILKDGELSEHTEKIYLFQPKLFFPADLERKKTLGPNYNKKGNLSDRGTYLLKKEDTVYSGYIGKREVLSGLPFDYVNSSKNIKNKEQFSHFIRIVLPQDINGNYVPVDFENKAELLEFDEYIKKFQTMRVESNDKNIEANYFLNILSEVKKAYQQYQNENNEKRLNNGIIEDKVNQRIVDGRKSRVCGRYDPITTYSWLNSFYHIGLSINETTNNEEQIVKKK